MEINHEETVRKENKTVKLFEISKYGAQDLGLFVSWECRCYCCVFKLEGYLRVLFILLSHTPCELHLSSR